MAFVAGERLTADRLNQETGIIKVSARPNANSPFWTTATAAGNSVTHNIAQVSIPDPGWPYRVLGTANFRANGVTGGPFSHAAAIRVDTTTWPAAAQESATVAYNFLGAFDSTGQFGIFQCSGRSRESFVGARNVYLLARSGATGTFTIGPLNAQLEYVFDIEIVRAD